MKGSSLPKARGQRGAQAPVCTAKKGALMLPRSCFHVRQNRKHDEEREGEPIGSLPVIMRQRDRGPLRPLPSLTAEGKPFGFSSLPTKQGDGRGALQVPSVQRERKEGRGVCFLLSYSAQAYVNAFCLVVMTSRKILLASILYRGGDPSFLFWRKEAIYFILRRWGPIYFLRSNFSTSRQTGAIGWKITAEVRETDYEGLTGQGETV